MAAPMAEVDPSAVLDTADPDATTDHRPPCPCCGGRMSLSRSLRAAPHRAARPRVVPGPGLRHHDDRGHFITRREMPLPVLQPAASGPLNIRAASPVTPIPPSRNRHRLHSDRCSWLPALSSADRRITRASRLAVKSL